MPKNTQNSQDKVKTGGWLAPGMALMRRFRMQSKLGVMAVLMILPLLLIACFEMSMMVSAYRTTPLEVPGAVAILGPSYAATQAQALMQKDQWQLRQNTLLWQMMAFGLFAFGCVLLAI